MAPAARECAEEMGPSEFERDSARMKLRRVSCARKGDPRLAKRASGVDATLARARLARCVRYVAMREERTSNMVHHSQKRSGPTGTCHLRESVPDCYTTVRTLLSENRCQLLYNKNNNWGYWLIQPTTDE
eukprot:212980-Prorocentrum_minimum.AAC.3